MQAILTSQYWMVHCNPIRPYRNCCCFWQVTFMYKLIQSTPWWCMWRVLEGNFYASFLVCPLKTPRHLSWSFSAWSEMQPSPIFVQMQPNTSLVGVNWLWYCALAFVRRHVILLLEGSSFTMQGAALSVDLVCTQNVLLSLSEKVCEVSAPPASRTRSHNLWCCEDFKAWPYADFPFTIVTGTRWRQWMSSFRYE